MSATTLFGLTAAALVGLGLYGLVTHPDPLRRILAFNVLGSGVFLVFGVIAHRGAGAGFGGDPVPQAIVITGMIVGFSATALGVALLLRMREQAHRAAADAGEPVPAGADRAPLSDGAGVGGG